MKINAQPIRLPTSSAPAFKASNAQAQRRPASRDEFVHDASARKALAKLDGSAGKSISAAELIAALEKGTNDKDAAAATGEYREFARFARQQGDRLTDGAKEVMELYARTAKRARAQGETGLTSKQSDRMFDAMRAVSEPKVDKPPKNDGPKTAKDWQRDAMRDADDIFKRQARHSKWNPNGPLRSGNCATCSLAMAVESFGLEPKKFDKPGHVMDQKSIARTAHHMPGKSDVKWVRRDGKLVRIHTGDFKSTKASQVRAGAKELGLRAAFRYECSMARLDKALAKGHMVVLAGEAGPKYRARVGHTFSGGHAILVMGKTSDGRYLVADPLSRKGPLKLTAEELRSFDTNNYTSNEVWRGK